jgi:hypothetical protein
MERALSADVPVVVAVSIHHFALDQIGQWQEREARF